MAKLDKAKQLIEQIRKNPVSLKRMMRKFEIYQEEYKKQLPQMDNKLMIASGESRIRIEEFKIDMTELNDFIEKCKIVLNKKGFKAKFIKLKFLNVDVKKMVYKAIYIGNKYKKEKGDIKNFEV